MDFDRGSAEELIDSAEAEVEEDLPAWARPPEWIQVQTIIMRKWAENGFLKRKKCKRYFLSSPPFATPPLPLSFPNPTVTPLFL